MKTKQMSYGLTWLFLTLLMVGMSWSAAVSPADENVLSSSADDSTSSTEVDIVAYDATETNMNDLIFEEEASEDFETKPLDVHSPWKILCITMRSLASDC